MVTRECGSCTYWVEDEKGGEGECRIRPPVLLVMPINTLGGPGVGALPMVPRTRGDFWCGEFKPAAGVTFAEGVKAAIEAR